MGVEGRVGGEEGVRLEWVERLKKNKILAILTRVSRWELAKGRKRHLAIT